MAAAILVESMYGEPNALHLPALHDLQISLSHWLPKLQCCCAGMATLSTLAAGEDQQKVLLLLAVLNQTLSCARLQAPCLLHS